MNEQSIDNAKMEWVKTHLTKTPFPVEYSARLDEHSPPIPMTAEQFNNLKNGGKYSHKFEPPATYKAVFPYKAGEDILWFTDNDIQNSTLEELQADYKKWKDIADSNDEPL